MMLSRPIMEERPGMGTLVIGSDESALALLETLLRNPDAEVPEAEVDNLPRFEMHGLRPAKSSRPPCKTIVSVRRLSPSAKQSNSSSRAAPAERAKPRSDLIRRLTGVSHRLSSPNQPTLQQRLQCRLG